MSSIEQHPGQKNFFWGMSEKGLNIELFAGGGGVSAGAAMIGIRFDIAINHNPIALAIHKANFPHCTQMVNDVFEYHPLIITQGKPVWRVHASPDCTYHSRAKGSALGRHTVCGDDCKTDHSKLTINDADRIRGLGWVLLAWCMTTAPKIISLENVIEFMQWGPTMVDQKGNIVPDPSKKGQTFDAFKGSLTTGIDKNHPALKEIRAFLEPLLEDDYDEQKLIDGLGYDIDFKELVASDYGAPTSRKRLFMIGRCDGKTLKWPKKTHGDPKSTAVKEGKLLPWRSAGECIDWSTPTPSIFKSKAEIKKELGITAVRPLADNTMKRIARGIKKFVLDVEEPYIVKDGRPYIQTYYGETSKEPRGNTLDKPLHTITAGGLRHGLVIPYVVNAKGTDSKRMPIGNSPKDPLTTITTSDSHGIVNATLASYCIKMKGDNLGYPCSHPVQTITAGGLSHGVISANLLKFYGADKDGQDIKKPLHTITTKERFGLISSHLLKLYGADKWGQGINQPLHTITSREKFGLVAEDLATQPLSEEQRYNAWWIARMMEEYGDTKINYLGSIMLERPCAVFVQDEYIIVDIGMRMLTVKELFKAQGFPEDFIYDPEVEVVSRGKVIKRKVTKTEAVRMVGNSVPPHFAKAIYEALDEV